MIFLLKPLVEGFTIPTSTTAWSETLVYKTHGLRNHRLYPVWKAMMSRCKNPLDKRWARYGARGIDVCERWLEVQNFVADMDQSYVPGLQIDRIDNNRGYSLANCRWATKAQQARNKHSNIQVTIDGVTKTAKEWARERGLSYGTVWERIRVLGWDPVAAVTDVPLSAHERCSRARSKRVSAIAASGRS